MNQLLEQLYMGEINVNEYFDPRTKEPLAQAIQQTRELEANFHASLTSEQQKVFEELMEQRVDATTREYINIFVEGFRMGAKLIIEVISDSK